jgi:hypothetical protein
MLAPGLQMECDHAIAGMILTLALAASTIFCGAWAYSDDIPSRGRARASGLVSHNSQYLFQHHGEIG